MEDVNKDYLTVYRQFFEGFAPTVDLYDQLPVKVASYNVAESEIDGEIIDWCLQYLNQRDCPPSLVIPLCSKVLEEIRQVYKRNLEYFGYRNDEDDFLTLRLMQAATKKLVEVCIRYTDNALLCTLPPPPPTGTLQAAPVSSCASKNARRTMEDRHVAIQDLHALFSIKDCGSASYYGVFDGHNGADAAVYSVSHLHQYLVESSYYPGNPELALRDAFRKTDERFNAKCVKENLRSGTTAVCALLRPKESMLYVAWLGDSQAVLVTQGKPYQLVKPHKPDQPEERERIEAMGGTVLFWGTWRVNGQLAVSRAIGDIDYKPYVSGDPDVRVIPLTGQEEFLILACDGLWDFMTEQSVSDTVYSHLAEHPGRF
ncbi:hypothetical protein AAG570_000752 [Ranatra chinensis]|uniref:PPM-type phosphatase domain-containing protein n=1 Tax=Ranatra chinensis TaxID=642074 RepID=A0ABD0Z030_9HEMI